MTYRSLVAGLSCLLWLNCGGVSFAADEPSSVKEPPAKQGAEEDSETLRVVSFSLINPKTQKPIKDFEKVTKNDKISISKLPVASINVAANIQGDVGSVRFLVPQKKLKRVENNAPFSMAGDIYGRFLSWKIEPGKYSLVAVPYSEANGRGDRGEYLRVDVEFVE